MSDASLTAGGLNPRVSLTAGSSVIIQNGNVSLTITQEETGILVTATDNTGTTFGRVSNGQSSAPLEVTITKDGSNNYISDKTFEEISEATADREVIACYISGSVKLRMFHSDQTTSYHRFLGFNGTDFITFDILSDNSVSYDTIEIEGTPYFVEINMPLTDAYHPVFNRTYDEVMSALRSGKVIYGLGTDNTLLNYIYTVSYCDTDEIQFTCSNNDQIITAVLYKEAEANDGRVVSVASSSEVADLWDAVGSITDSVFYVVNVTNSDGTTVVLDKTFDELSEAISLGKNVVIDDRTVTSGGFSKFVRAEFIGGIDQSGYYFSKYLDSVRVLYTITEESSTRSIVNLVTEADVYTKSQTDTLLQAKADSATVSGKADASSVYLRSDIDSFLDEKADVDDVYTKEATDTIIGSLDFARIELVNVLPLTGEDDVLYYLETSSGKFHAWMYVDSAWADMGDATTIDPSSYYSKSETNVLLGTKANVTDVYTKTATDTLLDEKADADEVYTSSQVDTLLGEKQGTLTFDPEPTEGSTNVVTSSAVYSALAGKAPVAHSHVVADISNLSSVVDPITASIATKAEASDVYGKSEVDQIEEQLMGQLADKQDLLISGETIKTFNGQSLLGSGDFVFTIPDTLYTKEEVNDLLDTKQDELISGVSVKTINGESVLGEGDLEIGVIDSYTKAETDAIVHENDVNVFDAGEEIADNSNLDNYISPGKYYCSSNTAATLTNSPFSEKFSMIVSYTAGEGRLTQRLTGNQITYFRHYNVSTQTFGSWRCLRTLSDALSIPSVSLAKDTAYPLVQSKFYILLFWHGSSANGRGLYVIRGGNLNVFEIIPASVITINLTSASVSFSVSGTGSPACRIIALE